MNGENEFQQALDAIRDADSHIAHPTLAALSGATRQEAAELVALLDHLAPERRHSLYDQMVLLAESDFSIDYVTIFRASLGYADPEIRRCAIKGLWEDPKPSLADLLIEMLHSDPDVSVRAAAAAGLGRYVYEAECEELDERRAQKLRETLEAVIGDSQEDTDVRRRAVEAIAFINDDVVRQIIDRAYLHSDVRMRISAVFAMGRNAEQRWEEAVLQELESEIPELRYEAARSAGEMQLRRAVPLLASLIESGDTELQETAIWSLGQIGGKQARRVLTHLSASDAPEISEAAEEALAETEFADMVFDMMVIDGDEDDLVEVDLADMALDDELDDDLDDMFGAEDQDDEDWPDDVISFN